MVQHSYSVVVQTFEMHAAEQTTFAKKKIVHPNGSNILQPNIFDFRETIKNYIGTYR